MNGQVKKTSGLFKDIKIVIRDKNGKVKHIHEESRDVTPRIFQRIIIKDKDGKVKSDETRESHSYTIQFLKILEGFWRNTTISTTDTSNTARSVPTSGFIGSAIRYIFYYINASDDTSTYGIVVGTGDNAESNTDYALQTQVAHGTGAGQLDYGEMGFVDPYVVGSNIDFILTRSFYNGSGNNVTCKEFGIYARSYESTTARYFCVLRDIEAGGKTVADGDTMTVQYTLRVGAGFCIAFMEIINSLWKNINESVEDTGNTSRTILYNNPSTGSTNRTFYFTIDANDDDDNYGVVIGSGDNAEDLEDYALETQIEHGVGAGQLDYQGHAWTTTQVVGANVDCIVSRNFYNGSGGAITINEVGIYTRCYGLTGGIYYFCIFRDKLSSGVIIADTDTGTIQYTLRTNVGT